jgi:hypothetical protein
MINKIADLRNSMCDFCFDSQEIVLSSFLEHSLWEVVNKINGVYFLLNSFYYNPTEELI